MKKGLFQQAAQSLQMPLLQTLQIAEVFYASFPFYHTDYEKDICLVDFFFIHNFGFFIKVILKYSQRLFYCECLMAKNIMATSTV